jgi:electron transfer flavoprotein alpha subunit
MSVRRRDPRAERLAQTSRGIHGLRLNRAQATAPPEGAGVMAPDRPAPILRIEDPAFWVAAMVDAPGGALTSHDRQVLGAARMLAEERGAVLLLSRDCVAGAGPAGADRVLVLPPLRDPACLAAHIAGVLEKFSVRHAIFAESADGGDVARRIGAQLGETVFTDVERLSPRETARPGRAGRSEFRISPTRLIAIAADCIAPYAGTMREARQVDMAFAAGAAQDFLEIEDLPHDPRGIALAEADFVAAAGNGVTDFGTFQALAAALGATPGASRVVCDAGLMPRDRQVGASGTVLSGRCYLAFGIAGAPQHLQGVAGVEHVIAVNTDLHAAMIKRAALAIVADAQAVMPALLKRLERTARG